MKYRNRWRLNEIAQGRDPDAGTRQAVASVASTGFDTTGLEAFVARGLAAQEAVSQLTADKNHYVNSDEAPVVAPAPAQPATETAMPATAESPMSSPPPKAKRKRVHYTLPEKRRILARAAASRLPLKEFCKQLGMHVGNIHRWRAEGIKPAASAVADEPATSKPSKAGKLQRHERASVEEKRFHLEQAFAPGAEPAAYAKEHGLSVSSLYRWKDTIATRAQKSDRLGAASSHASPELDRLRAEVEDLRMENMILKGALKLAERRGFDLFDLSGELARKAARR